MKTNLELKDDADAANPVEIVTKAVAELNKKVDEKLAAFESKSVDAAKADAAKAADAAKVADAAKMTERLDKLEAKMNRPGTAANDNKKLETKEANAYRTFIRGGKEAMQAEEIKSLVTSDDTRGGYLAPPEVSAELITFITQFSPIRSVASVKTTANPAVLLTVREGITNAVWDGEVEEETESTIPFGRLELPIFGMKTYADISQQLLEDAAQDPQAILNEALAEDYGRKEGMAFLNGTGIKQPRGIMVHPDVDYVPGGDASNLTSDGLIDLFHAVPSVYRSAGTWLLNSTSIGAVRKLKTSTGAPLWVDSLAVGNPATILGRPVVECVDMPSVTANSFPIVFGDFNSAYRIYDRVGLTVIRDPFTQATKGLVRFHSRRRVGGDVIKAEAIRKLKISVS